jgi:hypothetical protein
MENNELLAQQVPFETRLLQALLEGWLINGVGYIFYFCADCQEFIRLKENKKYPSIVSHGCCDKHMAERYEMMYHGE